jgi:predicted nucleotidyltransferase
MSNRNKLFLDDEDWRIFSDILSQYNCTVYAFGSRVKGNHSKFSDIDLCIIGNISLGALRENGNISLGALRENGNISLGELREKFEASDLTIKVDVKNYDEFSSEFANLVKDDFILIKKTSYFVK